MKVLMTNPVTAWPTEDKKIISYQFLQLLLRPSPGWCYQCLYYGWWVKTGSQTS